MSQATGENIFMINESFISILPQEARTPAVFHTVMESAETFSSQSISYTRPTRVAGALWAAHKTNTGCNRFLKQLQRLKV
jgi:hypothetical protein